MLLKNANNCHFYRCCSLAIVHLHALKNDNTSLLGISRHNPIGPGASVVQILRISRVNVI